MSVVIDTSALVAVVRRESGHEFLLTEMTRGRASLGAPSIVEASLVLVGRHGGDARSIVPRFIESVGPRVVSFGADHARVAADAFVRFGKGRHPAALNFGDCLTYAIASLVGWPVLCVGEDFAQTDIEVRRPPD